MGPTTKVSLCFAALAFSLAAWASPQEAFENARKAEEEGRHREAFDGYLEAWADPTLRHESARRARSLERIARLSSDDNTSATEPLEAKLGPGFKTYRSRSYLVLSDAPDDWTRGRITLLERAREQELESLAMKDKLPSLEQLVTLDDNTNLRADTARPIYAVAYGLFKELHRTQRDELAAYLGELADLPAGEQTPAQHLERFERHFGDVVALERRVARRWTAAARERQSQGEQARRTAGL